MSGTTDNGGADGDRLGVQFGRRSPAGFRLAPNGDPELGKAAFLAFHCNGCDEVSPRDLPRRARQPPVPIIMGGAVRSEPGAGPLVASMINPSYRLGEYPEEQVAVRGHSRMSYANEMTVQRLTDIVALLGIASRSLVFRYH